jgi:aminotransferase
MSTDSDTTAAGRRALINVFQPSLGAEELEAVRRVFESSWPGKGVVTDRFEAAFARHLGTDRALVRSANSCTEGLFTAMPLLGIGPGDEVVLPTVSFVGAANAVLASGARPVFCDVDGQSLNCTASSIEARLTKHSACRCITRSRTTTSNASSRRYADSILVHRVDAPGQLRRPALTGTPARNKTKQRETETQRRGGWVPAYGRLLGSSGGRTQAA